MHNLTLIEECYRKYISNLAKWTPEGIIDVNLKLLHNHDLIDFLEETRQEEETLTRYFHVVEAPEKITLINDQFIVWIVPENVEGTAITYTLISINNDGKPDLELVFTSTGVYNTSWLVLRVLEKFLLEIQENEELIKRYKAA